MLFSRRLMAALSVMVLSSAAFAQKTELNPQFPGAAIVSGTVANFNSACKNDMDYANREIVRLKAMKSPRNANQALQALDNANLALSYAANRADITQQVQPSQEMRTAGEKCGQEVSALATSISLDRGVYDAIVGLDVKAADPETQYLVKQTLTDFRRAGVDKSAEVRAKVKLLNDELTKIGQEFGKNIAAGVRSAQFTVEELDGLPDDYKKSHQPGADGKISINTTYPDYQPFMKYAKSSAARERLYRAYNQRAFPENMDVLNKMVWKRHELATLLGYKNWAEYVTETKMIGNAQNAADFIAKITAAADKRMKADYAELLDVAKTVDPTATEVKPWDSAFYNEKLLSTKYKFDSQAVRPYFEYTRVRDGLLGIAGKMYGVEFRPVKNATVWHPSVEAYDVVDGNRVLGRIYMDNFPRENKFSHAANFFVTPGRKGTHLPEMALVQNFPDPAKGPALLSQNDVSTFFHEFGHTVHLIFAGQPKWSGYSFQWDFIEAPSQMFEEWTVTPSTLQLFAKHYQTGEVIPAEMVKQLRRSNEVGKGLGVRRQMSLAALSLGLYNRDPKGLDTDEMVRNVTAQYTPFHYVEGTHFQTAFGHLDGYSAIYYTYMWSLVIARDLLTEFQRDGLMNPKTAMHYRKMILEPGAARPAAELVTKFLNRPYNFNAYEQWLNQTE
ncbi:MAG TPA: M3 family metallopeptidase [Terriglobales bacterium]|nr:M3 family metallopeptidase [Terriglobales bacterium]